MEDRYQHTINGQTVLQTDLNVMGETSALADDRVLAELLRMEPYNGSAVRKGILPHAHATSSTTALVAPETGTGSVLVYPFRAFVGPRTAASSDPKKNWRDIRSAIAVAESQQLYQRVNLSANSSGNPRWDLIWAAVAVDANTTEVTRKRKDPATRAITSTSVVTRLATTVTLGTTVGTAAASPVWPAVPADAAGVYYIPIAYVRIPNGFISSSTVLTTDIAIQAPILRISRAAGVPSVSVADQCHTVSTAEQQSWGSSGTRKRMWMPPDLTGGDQLVVIIDASDASSANWSHQNNGVVDSRDWRNRLTRYVICCDSGTDGNLFGHFPWNHTSGFLTPAGTSVSTTNAVGIGQTFRSDIGNAAGATGSSFVAMDDGAFVNLYCDTADGGKLKAAISGSPNCVVIFWIDFTAPFTNK